MKKLPLSKRENEAWGFILGYFSDNDYVPTSSEIARNLKIHQQQADALKINLILKGYLRRIDGQRWRNYEIIKGRFTKL